MDTEEAKPLLIAPPADFPCRMCGTVLGRCWPNTLVMGPAAAVGDRVMIRCETCGEKNLWRPSEVKRTWRRR